MTEWLARVRPPRKGTSGQLFCGRQVGGAYRCHEVIAQAALYPTDGDSAGAGVWLPVGLTDDGTPGIYRWSKYAQKRRGQRLAPRSGPEVRVVAIADLPIVVPCPHGHSNRIDSTVLKA